MAREVLFLVEDAAEGGYIARALGHFVFTEADTWEELKEAIRDAVRCHFDPAEDGSPTSFAQASDSRYNWARDEPCLGQERHRHRTPHAWRCSRTAVS